MKTIDSMQTIRMIAILSLNQNEEMTRKSQRTRRVCVLTEKRKNAHIELTFVAMTFSLWDFLFIVDAAIALHFSNSLAWISLYRSRAWYARVFACAATVIFPYFSFGDDTNQAAPTIRALSFSIYKCR